MKKHFLRMKQRFLTLFNFCLTDNILLQKKPSKESFEGLVLSERAQIISSLF